MVKKSKKDSLKTMKAMDEKIHILSRAEYRELPIWKRIQSEDRDVREKAVLAYG